MKKNRHLSLLMLAFLCSFTVAETIDSTGFWKMMSDTSATVPQGADTATGQPKKTDTLRTASAGTVKDTASKQPVVTNLKLVKRNYNSRQQILLASGMMIFVITMMTMAQQFNPN